MSALFENPIPIYAVSAVLVTLCVLVFFNRRDLPSLVAMIAVMLLAIVTILVEQVVVTDREQVENAVEEIMAAIEVNDVQGVLALVDPEATKVRSDVETMMPAVKVDDTGFTSLEVDDIAGTDPPTTSATFRGRVEGLHKSSGQRIFYFDLVRLDWIKRGDKWLLEGYQPTRNGKPIDAVGSLRTNRYQPAATGK